MQLRLATREDIDAIAVVLAEAFREEELHAYIFPGRDRWPEDYVRCWRECVQERWWDYSKVWVVGIEDEVDGGQGDLKAECEDEGEKLSKIVGVAEWQRVGPGWERLWGCRGWWDPRNATQHAVRALHQWQNWRVPNRSIRKPSSTDPSPITKLNFGLRMGPFMEGLFPHDAYWELCTLAVDPGNRLKGVGRELVEWGLVCARRDALPASVVCAKDTEDFYRRCGFNTSTGVASEAEIEDFVNPLAERGLGGGTILWTVDGERM